MKKTLLLLLLLSAPLFAQSTAKPGVQPAPEVRKLAPPSFLFRGQLAPTQIRNAAAVRLQDGRAVVASLVDTSGYSTDVAERFQGFLITEAKITVNGKPLAPGSYGIGTTDKGEFVVQDHGWNDVFVVPATEDKQMKRPRPLQMLEQGGAYRLYLGRRYVEIKAQ